MNIENYLSVLEQLLGELDNASTTIPVVVEGDRDEQSLRNLGIKGIILKLNVGMSVFNFCETLTDYHEVIILTDWDRTGQELRKKLKHALTANGIKPNDSFWLGLKHLCSREIQEVEHLDTYLKNLHKKNETK